MNNRWSSKPRQSASASRTLAGLLLAVGILGWAPNARARAPEWLPVLARAPLPNYPEDTNAVVLLNEKVTTVNNKGEIKARYRKAYKILRPEGRKHGTVRVYFGNETRLNYLKAWSLPAQGKEYEVQEKDAVETSPFEYVLYEDTRFKLLEIPAAEPGNVVGYEYEQKHRPYILQDTWDFQDEIPLQRVRFVLELPAEWEFQTHWINHPAPEPQAAGKNRWVWELANVPAVEQEPFMPPWRAVAGWLAVNFYPRRESLREKAIGSWPDLGRWYGKLTAGRRRATLEIKQKVSELTSAAPTLLDKLKALAGFVQRKVRYVAIEIGIGGYQPHAAREVFANLYGDCKDKATLLSAMLREIGIESHYVLVHTSRGAVVPQFPSGLSFNHAILAIQLPPEVATPTLYAVLEHERLGRVLFFDPTSRLTPLGYLPPTLQANYGLLVTEDGGELLELPLLQPATNRLLRVAKMALSPTGRLDGAVREVRWGAPATLRRAQFLEAPAAERSKVLENFLGNFLGGFALRSAEVENLEDLDKTLVLSYRFSASNYAQAAGDLLLVRPRVLGQKGWDLLEGEERKHPVEFPTTTLQSDIYEIVLPEGYQVEELPPAVEIDSPVGSYRSRVEVEGNILRYRRNYEIRDVLVPTERLDELKKFFRQVAADERNSAVLKRSAP